MTNRVLSRARGALTKRLDRRTVLKGAAAAGALTVLGGGQVVRSVVAQDSGDPTLAKTWVEEDNTGGLAAASVGGARTFQADFPFYAIAPHWGGDGGGDANVEISLSDDGQSWSDPVTVGEASADAGQPDRDGRHFGSLVFTPGASYVRYRGLDGAGNPATIPSLAFTYIDASNGPSINDVGGPATDPSVAPPPIILRPQWGADESYRFDANGNLIWPPEYQTVEHVIIHHTDTANFEDPLVAIRSIYYYHAVERGWGDIGYNYLVDFQGHVYEGRHSDEPQGDTNLVGGHAHQYAYGSSGIGTIGSFTNVEETPEALAGVVWITAWVGRFLDPLGAADFHETPNLPTICGHRDVNDTDCPGDVFYADLDTVRQRVNAVLNSGADPKPHPDYVPGDELTVIIDQANLRSQPGLGFDVVAQMAYGTSLTVTDGPTTNDGFTWYEVNGSYGSGWVASTLVQNANGGGKFHVNDTVTVNTDSLNLRTSPGLDADVVARMPFGTTGTVLDGPSTANGYDWYQLDTSYGTGWSAGDFLDPASSPPTTGQFSVGDTATVDTDRLNLRSAPRLSASVIATMPTGTSLTITQGASWSDGLTWYGVNSQTYGDGYCAGDFLAKAASGGISVGDTVKVIDGTLYLRSGPGLSADILASLPDATQLSVVDGPTSADGYVWYKVQNDTYGTGWCAGKYLQKV